MQAAGEAVRDYCQWHIAPVVQETRKYRRFPACLPTRKLVSLDSVTYDDGTVLDVSEIDAYENGELYSALRCSHDMWHHRFERPMTIVFTHGFEQTPPEVVGVVGSIVQRATIEAARGMIAGPFQIQANGTVSVDFNTYEQKILEKYRVVPFA